jgi:hypothetical protein
MTPPPLGPGRLRVPDTYRAYRRHGRFAAIAAGYGHLHGWLTGTLRSTVDGQRWMNVNVPGTRRLRRAAGITVQAIAVLAVAAGVGAPLGLFIGRRNGTTQVATLAALVGLAVLVEGIYAIWYWRRRRRCDVPPRRPQPCAVITTLAKAPDANIASLMALKRDLTSWLDSHDLALRVQARPELAPVYERFLSLHQVGTLPSLIDDATLIVLERPRRHSTT